MGGNGVEVGSASAGVADAEENFVLAPIQEVSATQEHAVDGDTHAIAGTDEPVAPHATASVDLPSTEPANSASLHQVTGNVLHAVTTFLYATMPVPAQRVSSSLLLCTCKRTAASLQPFGNIQLVLLSLSGCQHGRPQELA